MGPWIIDYGLDKFYHGPWTIDHVLNKLYYGPWTIDYGLNKNAMKKFKDADMQLLLGRVLRAGTVISISIVFFGGIIYLHRHGNSIADYKKFTGIPDFVQRAGTLIKGVFSFRGQAIIQMGIILLIATPILRVIFSAIGFILEKDYMYVGISLLVLLIIFASMMGGHAV